MYNWYLEHDVRRSLLDDNRHIIRMSALLSFFVSSILFLVALASISRGLVCLCNHYNFDLKACPFNAIQMLIRMMNTLDTIHKTMSGRSWKIGQQHTTLSIMISDVLSCCMFLFSFAPAQPWLRHFVKTQTQIGILIISARSKALRAAGWALPKDFPFGHQGSTPPFTFFWSEVWWTNKLTDLRTMSVISIDSEKKLL